MVLKPRGSPPPKKNLNETKQNCEQLKHVCYMNKINVELYTVVVFYFGKSPS